jgi:hypothetical protein
MLMPTIPGSFTELLAGFRARFTAPTFATFMALCAGLLAQPGPSTVTGMLMTARAGRRIGWGHCWVVVPEAPYSEAAGGFSTAVR